jgi:hypothetical protein
MKITDKPETKATNVLRISFAKITPARFGGWLISVFPMLALMAPAQAQQFMGDNQWTAPHGVSTQAVTVGEEYSQYIFVLAFKEDWEINAQFTHYYDDPRDSTESHTSSSFYVKHRISENDAGTTGYSVFIGTGLNPDYLDQGEVTQAFESYFSTLTATYGWNNDRVLLDVIPGFTVNLDQGDMDETAWGFTYASRLAIYDVIPQSAIVTEVFGTTGEAYAPPSYRAGVRWEGKKWIVAGTYSDAFDGSVGAGFEIGIIYFTDPRFCFGGCKR